MIYLDDTILLLISDRKDTVRARRLVKIIVDFVKSGVPYPGLYPISPNKTDNKYLEFGRRLTIRTDYTKTFWRYFS